MKKVNFTPYSPLHKTGHTSKGDQNKWEIGDTWYKADYMGYESLAEVLVSHLLQKSDCLFPFVIYESVQIEYRGKIFQGCSSKNFLQKNQMLIPLEKLYRQNTGNSLAVRLSEFTDVTERIQYTVQQVESFTGFKVFGEYLTAMLEIDAFFLNEDRHTNNISVIYDEVTRQYSLSPFFDQGLCLFADTRQDYPLELPLETCMENIEAKPFSASFDEQLEAAESLYGTQIQFRFTIKDIQAEIQKSAAAYQPEICSRIESLLRMQMRKYRYLLA